MKLLNQPKTRGDISILIAVTLITAFGVLMVYSASYYQAEITYGNKYFYLKKQLIGFVLGLISMIATAMIDYKKIIKLRFVLLGVSALLLILVLTPLGVENYGARRWLKVGPITIQPSEIAKFSLALFCAGHFAKKPARAKTFKGVIPVLLAGGVICLLIMLEPNMSITVCVGALLLVMLYVSGVKKRFLFMIIIPVIIALPLLIILEPYRLKRLMAFVNPWASPKGEGYQLLQSLYALGSGGLFGVGLFNSRQKLRFLPFAESDFILSIIGEEFGFVGTAILFLVFLFIVIRGIKIAVKCTNYFGYLLGLGIITVFAVQTLVNVLVVTGSIPPTGLPLPLISSGNTSIIVFMSAFGVLYSISKDSEKI